MTDFDQSDLVKLGELCCLSLSQEEIDTLSQNLRKILDHVELLSVVDTEEVPICTHVIPELQTVFREDVEEESLSRDLFLQGAPHTGGMVRVPPVLKEANA
ncbi:MAG: Asp-tRNA(Asn)/Glu-tRNA(Gln) amidotransferase subunit GatC [Simkaniaceae bacterium]|nr:Asp-tRNA(Asn)/Glu-tRNA(Gln) amidotransferase subunit GatC [Simkaniaceae bacterium]